MLKSLVQKREKRQRAARNAVQWTLYGSQGTSCTFEELCKLVDLPKHHIRVALRDLVSEGQISRRVVMVATCLGRGETVHYSLVLVTSGGSNHA